MTEMEQYLADILGHIILKGGPVLIENAQWEAGLPEDALGVMVEKTQEGYLVFITDKEFTNDDTTDGNGDGISPDVQTDDQPSTDA